MRALILALAAAGFVAVSLPGYAADEPYTAQPKATKPGRAIDEGTVKSGGPSYKPGRAIDDTVKTSKDYTKPGRAIDDGTVKSGKDLSKPGRQADDTATPKKKKKKKTATPQN